MVSQNLWKPKRGHADAVRPDAIWVIKIWEGGYNGSRRTILSDQSRQSSQPLMHCAHSKLISAPIAWPTICLLQKLVAVIRLQFPSTGEHDWLPYYVGCPVDNSGFILCGIFLVKVFALLSFLKEIRRIASSRARWPWATVVNSQVHRCGIASRLCLIFFRYTYLK